MDLVPPPNRIVLSGNHIVLGPATPVSAPPEIAALIGEVLGWRVPGPGGLEMSIVDDVALGPEGYRLSVTDDGAVRAGGPVAGLRWAVQTLRQLRTARGGQGPLWTVPVLDLVDRPRYAWRGSLLDVARWCHPIQFVHRYVDLMALHKLNTLHLHLTDDQGWRFEVTRYPRLTEVGGYRAESSAGHARAGRFDGVPHGGWYTQAELRNLVAYAGRRGVRVMPELDVPGHMQAAIAAYPELGNDPAARLPVRTVWGISRHVLNTADATVRFVRDVLDELTDVFPFEVVHVGGDEVPPDEWRASPAAQARAAAHGLSTVDELVGWWAGELAAHLDRAGRRIGVWDELLDRRPPPDALIFAWQDAGRVAAARAGGFEVVAAPQEHAYLDWAETDAPDEPLAIRAALPLAQAYRYDPGEVLGLQGQLWSEYLPTPELVEWRAYPRLAALADVAWSGPGRYEDFRARLTGHLPRLDALGVNYHPLTDD